MDLTQFNPDQLIELGKQLLVVLGPYLVEVINKLAEKMGAKLPWFLKPLLSALVSALIGMISDLGVVGGASAGLAASAAYNIKQRKDPFNV